MMVFAFIYICKYKIKKGFATSTHLKLRTHDVRLPVYLMECATTQTINLKLTRWIVRVLLTAPRVLC